MQVYRIRRKTDGLFSMGGTHPSFNSIGKIWKQKGHLTNHLNLVSEARPYLRDGKGIYDDCELVTYELSEQEIDSVPLSQYIEERKEAHRLREEEQQRRWDERKKERRRRQYEELKQEFEPN